MLHTRQSSGIDLIGHSDGPRMFQSRFRQIAHVIAHDELNGESLGSAPGTPQGDATR
jgi:hypothetical protein